MTDVQKGKVTRTLSAEDMLRLERMARLRWEMQERRLRRVQLIQSLHC